MRAQKERHAVSVLDLTGVEIHFRVSLQSNGALDFSYYLVNGQAKRHWTTSSALHSTPAIQREICGSLMQSLVGVGNQLHNNCEPVDPFSCGPLKSTDHGISSLSATWPSDMPQTTESSKTSRLFEAFRTWFRDVKR